MKKKHRNLVFSSSERIKIARSIAGFSSRKAFCEVVGIPLPTMETWEKKGGILSVKGAKRLTVGLEKLGVTCSQEWLLRGSGFFPQNVHATREKDIFFENKNKTESPDKKTVFKEISIFLNQSSRAVVLFVKDHKMYPFYEKGDYVGGLRLFKEDIPQALGRNCIIEKEDGSIIVRRLEESQIKDHYSLFCYTPSENYSFLSACDVSLKSVAPIIWHRKIRTLNQQILTIT